MQTNNLYTIQAFGHSPRLQVNDAHGRKAATVYSTGVDTFALDMLRPVELRWLAIACEQFDQVHAAVVRLTTCENGVVSLDKLPEVE